MKNLVHVIFLSILFIACSGEEEKTKTTTKDSEESSLPDGTQVFHGYIGDDIEVNMKLDIENGKVTVHYYYLQFATEIVVQGVIHENDSTELMEYHNEKQTGRFIGLLQDGKYQGNWVSPDGKKMEFDLDRATIAYYENPLKEKQREIEQLETMKLPTHYYHFLQKCVPGHELESLVLSDSVENDYGGWDKTITEEQFEDLSMESRLLYCMKFPESWDQICAPSPSYDEGKVYSSLPFDDSGESWSNRQYEFIHDNRDFVVNTILDCVEEHHDLDLDGYNTLSALDAYEAIPILHDLYVRGELKHSYTLALFIEFMNEFEPYTTWADESSLWEPEDLTEEEEMWGVYYTGVNLTEEIEEKILDLALQFYGIAN